ncbi:outer membrane protein assembly factor BamD [Granulicella sp. S190]|uniref:outer membrane protein assembly factor BamD n=1 Tax=Granulicella sp. S190 TaxID=1747226 RepID=UPI00131D390C|nr:outer membrane protein assembly factor BamD [Granulicella sp. S190]
MNKRSFFPTLRASVLAGMVLAGLMGGSLSSMAQVAGSSQTTTDANGQQHESVTLSATPDKKKDKVVQSKDTKQEMRKEKAMKPADMPDAKLPDKVLYDKALDATKRGHFDVARLDLQTLLNTYPDSQYQMKAKLAIGDSWYREGGTAALTQAESEYKDFITFFPNAPEAAEAQMRVGDIYFRQMDKPDRDYAKAVHAEEEYRLMLQQFPESTLVPQAKQRLREVQEVMATREANIAAFYGTHNNYPATIARYQTVVDTYPQYSHMDDVLVGLGDAYEAEARFVRTMKLPEAGKAKLEKIYDDQAIAAYSKVVLDHSASPHVEDARDRLDALNVKIPQPTPEQIAASVALENSRRQYRLQDRARLLILHQPDVVMAARDGEPTLADPTPTIAPHVVNQIKADFTDALSPNAPAAGAPLSAKPAATTDAASTGDAPAAAPAAPTAPLALSDVPAADASGAGTSGTSSTTSISGAAPTPPARSGSTIGGVEILNSGASGTTVPDSGGLKAVGPTNSTPLPAAEKAADAPDAINDIKPGTQPAAQASAANGKNKKPGFDKSDESDSKHKKKKGLNKLNPF